MKTAKLQPDKQRKPRQARAQEKVELILEAAMRLMAKGGLEALTTNAVAETAGVSIGTLYQYFKNKEAILDALADREMALLSERIVGILKEPGAITPSERVARIIGAISTAYGGRKQVHRIVMGYSLARGGKRLTPLIDRLVALLSAEGRLDSDGKPLPTSAADAFVLTNAFAGVMRARILAQDGGIPPQAEIEDSLTRLIVSFAGRAA